MTRILFRPWPSRWSKSVATVSEETAEVSGPNHRGRAVSLGVRYHPRPTGRQHVR